MIHYFRVRNGNTKFREIFFYINSNENKPHHCCELCEKTQLGKRASQHCCRRFCYRLQMTVKIVCILVKNGRGDVSKQNLLSSACADGILDVVVADVDGLTTKNIIISLFRKHCTVQQSGL